MKHKKMKKGAVIAIVVICIAVVLSVFGVHYLNQNKDDVVVSDISSTDDDTNDRDDNHIDSSNEENDDQEDSEKADQETAVNDKSGNSGQSNVTGGSDYIMFPFTIEETALEISEVFEYSGNYIEDGSDAEIGSVAAIQVKNISSQTIEYGTVNLTADGQDLTFEFSLLPAGYSAFVMEANQKSASETADYSYVNSNVSYTTLSLLEDQLGITDNGDGSLTVTNNSGSDIGTVRIFYKNKMDDLYLGGIAYTAKITDLSAGQSITVSPAHFVAGYSDILMARIYD